MGKGLAVLGSSGSIGRNTLEIVRRHPDRFSVVSLSTATSIELLRKQIEEFRPRFVSVLAASDALRLKRGLKVPVEVGYGEEGAVMAACFDGVDMTVSAIAGAAGLLPTLSAIRAGKDVALANKETLVMAGPLVMDEVRRRGVRLLPVDSEHSAIMQATEGHRREHIKRLMLTASGGPFLKTPVKRLNDVTPEEALRHPRWSMGMKITIDSATLMNKGLEVIEARWLFDIPPERISVYIHPQSIVHSMVEYTDGSVVSQMADPDMKGPIAYALSYPERIESGIAPLDFRGLKLEFFEPEVKRFPCLGLAYEALREGGVMPAVLNASDEVAVDAFLEGRIRFTDIFRVVSEVLDGFGANSGPLRIEDVLEADGLARRKAREAIRSLGRD